MKKLIWGIAVIFLLTTTAAAELQILTAEEPPTNYTLDGKVTGTTTDIVEGIKNELGTDTPIKLMPWARAYSIAKSEPDVAIYTCGKTQERIDLGFHFIGPVITRKHALFKKKGTSVSVESLADIKDKGYKVAGVRGDWRSSYLMDEGIAVDESAEHINGLKKLDLGRVDLWISSDIEAPTVAKKLGVDLKDFEIAYVIKASSSFIMLSKGTDPATVTAWQTAFKKLQNSDFFDKAAAKWTQILGMNIGFAPDRGFIIE